MDCQYRRNSDSPRQQRRKRESEPPTELIRAKRKALKLLERMDRTEAQLRQKLLDADLSPEAVEAAVAYVKSYGYIDDERYVRNYIEYRQGQKSRRQLEQELQFRKGVSPELIRKVYQELEPVDERILIRHFLEKKRFDPREADERERRRLMAALSRKGFRMHDILEEMKA